jgi:catechol 2,3-dioxygenase-like lactoylglutathione lyase family enzyme
MAAERYRSARAPRPDTLGLDHVQVAAPRGCEPAARAFYGGLLGLPEQDKPTELAGRGGVWFTLARGAALHVGVAEAGFSPAVKAHPALRAADEAALRMLADTLRRAGAPVRWDDPLPGVAARFFTDDPWGNRIELLC